MKHILRLIPQLLFLGLLPVGLSAQRAAIVDSLEQVYQQTEVPIDKVKVLEQLFNATLYTDPSKALAYPLEALKLAQANDFTSGVVTSYYNIGVYHNTINQNDSSEHYYHKAMAALKKTDIPHLYIIVNSALANSDYLRGDYVGAIRREEIGDSIARSMGRYLMAGIARGDIGRMYKEMGYYKLALENCLAGLTILDTIAEEPFRKADIMRVIADIYTQQEQYDKALSYQDAALQIYLDTDDKVYEAFTYNDKGNTYADLKNYEQAIHYYERAIALGEQINGQEAILDANSNLGGIYNELKQYDEALKYLNYSLDYYRKNDSDQNDFSLLLIELAKNHTARKDWPSAWALAQEVTTIADTLDNINIKQKVYRLRADMYQASGDYPAALDAYQTAQVYQDSLLDAKKNQQLSELSTVYETEQKEKQIALQQQRIINLEQAAKISRLNKILLFIGLLAASALALLIYFVARNRLRQKQQQQQLLEQEITFKEKELLSQTVHLVEKNTFLQQLKERFESAIATPPQLKQEVERILLYLRREQAEDQTWEAFKSYFTAIHDDFSAKIRDISQGDITEKEMRLAAFLRMNLSTKEIATLLNVLPESVLKSKYRLKKKLALGKEQDLQRFLEEM